MGIPFFEEKKIYREALDIWGIEAQEGMLLEEIGEVLQAFNKRNRNTNGGTQVEYLEELVDLKIILDQLELAYGQPFQEIKCKKFERLKKMLKEERGQQQ